MRSEPDELRGREHRRDDRAVQRSGALHSGHVRRDPDRELHHDPGTAFRGEGLGRDDRHVHRAVRR